MIHFQSNYQPALSTLRKLLQDTHFDLLVRELKLPKFYFQEPGFIYYKHSIDHLLTRIGEKRALLIKLFSLNQKVDLAECHQHLSTTLTEELTSLGLLMVENGMVQTDAYGVIPFLGTYLIATIGTARSIGAYLGRQSYILATSLVNHNGNSFLDIGTGCGVLAILAARKAKISVGIDIIPEAVNVAQANAVLSNVADRTEFFCGNMYNPVKGRDFDIIVANTPFMALPDQYKDLVSVSSGEDGLSFLRPLIEGFSAHHPKLVRLIANGLGNESQPLIQNLLEKADLVTSGYRALLQIYAKGFIDEQFATAAAKIVGGSYRDHGEQIDIKDIIGQLYALYKKIAVNSYYGILLELELSDRKPTIETIDLTTRYNLQSVPILRNKELAIKEDNSWVAKLDSTNMPISLNEYQILTNGIANGDLLTEDQMQDLYSRMDRVLGIV